MERSGSCRVVPGETWLVVDSAGQEVFCVAKGWGDDDAQRIAAYICDFANGATPDLPESLRYHWYRRMASNGAGVQALFLNAPIPPGREWSGAYCAQAIGRCSDQSLAQAITDSVSRSLGWMEDGGVLRGAFANTSLLVKPERPGEWSVMVGGTDLPKNFSDRDAAKAAAEAEVIRRRTAA